MSYAKIKDRYKHLFTTSFWGQHYNDNYDIASIPQIDFLCDHHYSPDYNMSYQYNYLLKRGIKKFSKPAINGEFNIATPSIYLGKWIGVLNNTTIPGNPNESRPLYNEFQMHNILWSSLFAGRGGPGFYWGDGSSAMTRDNWNACWGGQFRNFTQLATFINNDKSLHAHGIPISTECNDDGQSGSNPTYDESLSTIAGGSSKKCVPVNASWDNELAYKCKGITTSNDVNLEAFAIKSEDKVIGWVHYKQNYYANVRHKTGNPTVYHPQTGFINPAVLTGQTMTVRNLCKGTYKVEFFNTYPGFDPDGNLNVDDGGIIPAYTLDPIYADCEGDLVISLPNFKAIDNATITDANNGIFVFPDYGFKITKLSDNWSFHQLTHDNSEVVVGHIVTANNNVFYVGNNNELHHLSPSSNSTYNHSILTNGMLATKATGYLAVNENADRVFFKNGNNDLHYYYYTGGSWLDGTISQPGEEVGYGIGCSNDGNHVFYIGADNKLHYYNFSGGSWSHQTLHNNSDEIGIGTLDVSPDGTNVYYRGHGTNTYDKLIRYYNNSGTWTSEVIWNNSAENVHYEIHVDNTNTNVYYIGTGKIHNYKLINGIWTHSILQHMESGNWVDDAVSTSGGMALSDDGSHLYYVGTNNIVYQKYHITPGVFQSWNDELVCWNQITNDRKASFNENRLVCDEGHVFFKGLTSMQVSSFIWNAGCDELSPYYSALKSTENNNNGTEQGLSNNLQATTNQNNPQKQQHKLEQMNKELTFTVYPNPFIQSLQVKFNQQVKYNIQMVNSLGQIVYSSQIDGEDHNISTEKLALGLYSILIKDLDGSIIKVAKVTKTN